MIREQLAGNLEAINAYLWRVQDEIKFHARRPAWIGWQAKLIGTSQTGSLTEQEYLVVAPEGIEVTCYYHWLSGLLDQTVQIAQLIMTMPEFK